MPKTRSRRRKKLGSDGGRRPISGIPSTVESEATESEGRGVREQQSPSPVVEVPTVSSQTIGTSEISIDEDGEPMQLSRDFRMLCSRHANPDYAKSIGRYMRNQFAFFGIKAPLRRQLQKQFTSEHREKLTDRSFLSQFVVCLWSQEERECQLYGVDLMSDFCEVILGGTEAEYEEAVVCARVLITTKSWWDTVDMLASQMVGHIVSQRREKGVALMKEWIGHSCMWLRRTALLHQLNYKTDTDKDLFCLSVAHEEEFFIRKAIGWALRQFARTDANAVRSFVEKNRGSLSNLSIREALKHL